MSFTAKGTIEIDLKELLIWVHENNAPANGVEYHYGDPRVNKSNETLEIDFAMTKSLLRLNAKSVAQ